MKKLVVLGPGCPRCETLADLARQAADQLGIDFHGDVRCATCRKLEAYSEEAVTEAFPEELAAGTLAWRPVNTDRSENAHFVEDFSLVTKSLVLVEYRDGEVVRFRNLAKIWQKVRDKDAFLDYVRDEARQFVETS